jgi:hypothetical protein
MRTLYVYSGNDNISIKNKNNDKIMSYYVGTGKVFCENLSNINDQDALSNVALENIDIYSDFIFSLNNIFIEKNLLFNKDLSLYFLTDLSCKRTELFNTFMHYCNSIYINECIKKYKIDNVVMDSCEDGLVQSIKSILGNITYIERNTKFKRRYIIKSLLRSTSFFIGTICKVIFCKIYTKNKFVRENKINNIFLTRFPLHLSKENKEGKFGDFVKDGDSFLVNIITDGYHQNINIKDFINSLKTLSTKENVILLDKYLKLKDIFACFTYSFILRFKSRALFKRNYICNGINISNDIHYELSFSMKRIPRLLMWKNSINDLLRDYSIHNFYYYLFEYSYGKFFTYALGSQETKINLIGFQHGPSSMNKILHMSAKGELVDNGDWVKSFQPPKKIFSEDVNSAFIYRKAGYRNVEIMDKIYRLSYLNQLKTIGPGATCFVIVPGLHDGEFLLSLLKERIEKDKQVKYIINLHPRANNSFVKNFSNISNLSIATSLNDSLSVAEKVIGTYSSALVEAYLLGISVEMVEIPGKINESPLRDKLFLENSYKIKF